MKIKTDYVPADCDYLTAGKEYDFKELWKNEGVIVDDTGIEIYIMLEKCSLIGRTWTIVQDEPQFSQEQAREMYEMLKYIRGMQALGSPLGVNITRLLNKLESNDE